MRHPIHVGIAILVLSLTAGCALRAPAEPEVQAAREPSPTPAATTAATSPGAPTVSEPAPIPGALAAIPKAAGASSLPAQETPAAKPAPPKSTPSTPKPPPAPVVGSASTLTPKPAPLDLASLEQRVRATTALGTFSKIALKNQVDDLLDQFRSYYQGKLATDLKTLRQSYELLLMKFVALLQDDDKPLANAIVASREEIWAVLSDRTRFASL